MASGSSNTPLNSTASSISKLKDFGWNFGTPIEGKKDAVKCKFCHQIKNGGITRLKQHLVGGFKNANKCPSCPADVRATIKEHMESAKAAKIAKNQVFDFDNVVDIDDGSYDDDDSVTPSAPVRKGPMDMFFNREPTKKRKMSEIEEKADEKKRDKAVQALARWMYDAGIAFNALNYRSFQKAIEAVGQYGPGMKAPSMHEVRVTCLKKEKDRTEKLIKDHKEEAEENGCTLMADGWTDRKHRSIVNFLMNTPKGSVFLDSIDVSAFCKDAILMTDLLSKYIKQIGQKNVVQVVTDNASENVLAGKHLELMFPNIYWTPCAAHCIDLMMEDIFKLSRFKGVIEKAIRVNGYIYSRTRCLHMLRKFTKDKEMIRPAKTRFATSFLTLKRFQEEKINLLQLFASDEWHNSKFAKEAKGKKIQKTLNESFWRNTNDVLKIGGPLLTVLRLVDGEKSPAMGYIYGAMDTAKETIAKAFKGNESKYKDVFEIIDTRWTNQMHRPLHAAGYYLNPVLFYNNKNVHSDAKIMEGFRNCCAK